MVEPVPQGRGVEDDDVAGSMTARAFITGALVLTAALLVGAQTRQAVIPLQSGDVVIRGGLIFDSVRDDAVVNSGLIVRNGTILEVNADLTGRDLAPARVIDLPATETILPGLF